MKDKLKKVKKPTDLLKKKKKLGEPKKTVNMQDMSVDDFMNGFMNEEDVSDSDNIKEKKKSTKKLANKKSSSEVTGFELEEENDKEEEESDLDMDEEFKSHKKQLKGLKKSDPEFYKYLEENDQDLLNFDDSDLDSDDGEEKVHKGPDTLEVASDESDYEPESEIVKARGGGAKGKLTTQMIAQWEQDLKNRKTNLAALRNIVEAFHGALVSVSQEDDQTCKYKVEGAAIFNSVMRLCVMNVLPGVQKALKLPAGSKMHPEKCKTWNKVKPVLKNYLTDLLEFCNVSSTSMLRVLLKHIHQMSPFIACFPSISPKFLKRVIQLWAMDEDVIRVLAFLCTLRLCNLRMSLLKVGLKMMHLTYVRNTKFISPNSLQGVNFMRQSLCEMFALNDTISYQMIFLFIRQLAIHLRNAITLKKKEAYKTVYNWAYISSLQLWAELFGLVSNNSPLKSLLYPLVQIIIGTIKLIPSSQYYPLRFHCCRILINLSQKCDVFIPILPFLLEVLRDFDFNREHKKLSMKPMDFTCLLRCSKSQMKENGFKDGLIENIHNLLMEYLAAESHRVSFPDITVPCVIQVKQFLKVCKVVNYNKKLKAILDKLAENSKFIEAERKKLTLKLEDLRGVEAAEAAIRAKEPPFLKYYESWRKIHVQQQAKKITNNEKLGDFKLPVIYKLDRKRSRLENKSVGPPELFPSDDDDSDGCGDLFKDVENEESEPSEPPKKRKKGQTKPEKKVKVKVERKNEDLDEDIVGDDIVTDLNYADL